MISYYKSLLNLQRVTRICQRYDSYASTIKNMKLTAESKVIVQGITGKQATIYCKDALSIGTKVVGGVSPEKGSSTHLDLPVFKTVVEAKKELDPQASIIFVPPAAALSAIMESIEAEIPLIVCITFGVPRQDQSRINLALKSQSKTRLIGPSSPGILVPSQCKIGIMPNEIFTPGEIGIISRSGSLTYEAAYQTTKLGLGQSTVVCIGTDVMLGTNFIDCLAFYIKDPHTHGIIIIGEIGGTAEEDAAEYLKKHNLGEKSKPVVAFLAGYTAPYGRHIPTHVGAIVEHGIGSAERKRDALERANVVVTKNPSKIGYRMQQEMHLHKDLPIEPYQSMTKRR